MGYRQNSQEDQQLGDNEKKEAKNETKKVQILGWRRSKIVLASQNSVQKDKQLKQKDLLRYKLKMIYGVW